MRVRAKELVSTEEASVPMRGLAGSLPRLGVWISAASWTVLAVLWSMGSAQLFGHDQDGVPAVLALALFLIGWLVMSAAMMLPSSLPTLRAIDQPGQTGQGARAASLMLGYFSAWAIFGVAAFAGDGMLHRAVELMPWLSERTWLIRAGIAMFAGAAEVLGRPAPPRTPEVPPGAGWFSVGKRHAVDRIRRCWPVMLFAMAVGMGNPLWMVGLTCVMALELRPRAHVALRIIGLGLLLLGAAVVIEPDWAPLLVGPGT